MILACILLGMVDIHVQAVNLMDREGDATPFVVALDTQSPQQMFGVSYLQKKAETLNRCPVSKRFSWSIYLPDVELDVEVAKGM